MHRLATTSGVAFLVLAAVVLPLAGLPPSVSRDITVTYYGAKMIVGWLAVLVGWIAVLSAMRSAPLKAIAREVFVRGFSRWLTAFSIITFVAAAVNGPDLNTAFLGTLLRLDGAAVAIMIYHLAQIGAALVRLHIVSIDTVVTGVVAGGLGAAAFIFAEASGFYPWSILVSGLGAGTQPVGTIGHPGALTIYFAVLYVTAVMRSGSLSRWASAATWAAALAFVGVMALHVGRAGVGGAVISLTVVSFLLLSQRDRRGWLGAAGIAILIIGIATWSNLNAWSASRTDRLTQLAVTGAEAEDLSLNTRLITWRLGALALMDQPLLGSGTGSFADRLWTYATSNEERTLLRLVVPDAALDRVRRDGRFLSWYDPEQNVLAVGTFDYDKAHNYFLDIGIHSGVFAVLAMAGFWIALLLASVRSIKHRPELLAGVLAYLLALQFWFINVNIDPPLVLLLASLAAGSPPRSDPVEARSPAVG